ncbi:MULTISPECIES: hypothetical protein [unclassified Pseudomonas]|uniref:hypothetical protein n=1 Tax=unclassified Pseudomonas TaxID=196821 RepID=UPI000C86A8D0|nr:MULTISPECIES: hypothetical protein [unclassified Pseudomonas]PMV96482.1 hypothetical protein C1X55_19310 [Pseudomonas sp. GW460-C8]PMW23390.1 hypothetical protein C1X53_12610 [Pseudomonas sp. GW456-E6]PMW24134.1 hypothetical protein C1X40_04775 [Pseudomonas sp. GW456-11-11-14-TSB2]PMW40028.1 hypothetical protein C1X45_08085 [Pseudomonas sp. GW460-7]PMW41139.1 hypothetical protein C1X48_06720 [Pseudomonas sp. FW305-3-2-15-A-R2A1]
MKFQNAFDRMTAIVESEQCILTGYRQDFYQFDRDHLANTGTVGGRYVWVLRENGTHLASIGLHPRTTEFVECALNSFEKVQTYEITLLPDGDADIKPITAAKARELIKTCAFEFQGRHIKQKGKLLATVDIQPQYNQGKYGGKVCFTFDDTPSSDTEVRFKQIALHLFQERVGTLFACMDEVTFHTHSARS